jgi:Glucose-6-phosphate dehydrogenase, C-terminal domain
VIELLVVPVLLLFSSQAMLTQDFPVCASAVTTVIKTMLLLRFGNAIFEPLWNRNHISSVTFSFKEKFGTQGRGGVRVQLLPESVT